VLQSSDFVLGSAVLQPPRTITARYNTVHIRWGRFNHNELTNSILRSESWSFCLLGSGGSASSMCVRA